MSDSTPPFSDQRVLTLNHRLVVDAFEWKPGTPGDICKLNCEVAQSVVEVIGVDVVVGELEVVAAGAEVAIDVVAVGSWFVH